MTLVSLKETYPDYRNQFSDNSLSHIDDYSVYASGDDKVGTVEDGLFDDTTGQFRYLIVDTGVWIFGKKVLLPIGAARFDNAQERVYVEGLTKDQVEHLPKYEGTKSVDYDYEERVRGVYRENSVEQSVPVEGTGIAAGTSAAVGTAAGRAYTPDTYRYDEHDADLYAMDRTDENQPIRLYEERLVAGKERVQAGAVRVGKRVESQTAEVSVPLEKERVVIERTTPTTTTGVATDHVFEDGEVANVEVFEEQANVRKEAFVREEVNVRKETREEVVHEQATVRREELDVDGDGVADIIDNK
ncbi:MAG: DUF2382 domain-containing protein [Phormidesmis sp.]